MSLADSQRSSLKFEGSANPLSGTNGGDDDANIPSFKPVLRREATQSYVAINSDQFNVLLQSIESKA